MGPSSAVAPPPRRRRGKGRLEGGRASHGLRGFSRRIKSLQYQEQLPGIDLFALRTEEPFDQRIDLFPQQLDLDALPLVFRRRACELFG